MSKYKSLDDIQRAIDDYQSYPTSQRNGISSELHTLDVIRDIMARPDEPEPDTRYNGWTNYATWRVNLEVWSGEDWTQAGITFATVGELCRYLEDTTDEILTNYGENEDGLALNYARSFVSGVDWRELAEHYAEDFPGLIESDDDDDDDTDDEE